VQGAHDLKVRSSGGLYQVQVRVVVASTLTVVEGHRVAESVERGLRADITEVAEAIVHVDPVGATRTEHGPVQGRADG
jgi:divalent metal cation (Fe/Co/Zn/Cd) transporter